MNDFILHITSRTAWSGGQAGGEYSADSLAGEGFIHCSKEDQVLRVAENFFNGQHGLLLLVVDPARLTSALHWEPGVDLPNELFPHVHGPINVDAVVNVLTFEPDTDGKFHLPKHLNKITRV